MNFEVYAFDEIAGLFGACLVKHQLCAVEGMGQLR